jgi:hypothetical protein
MDGTSLTFGIDDCRKNYSNTHEINPVFNNCHSEPFCLIYGILLGVA